MKMPIHTTLNEILKYSPCQDEWEKLLKGLGKTKADDEPLLFSDILRINDFDFALLCLEAAPRKYDTKIRLFIVSVARRVQHLMKDKRSINAIDVAERYAKGKAIEEELSESCSAAKVAESSAVSPAAWLAARSAAKVARWSAAWSAAEAAWAARAALTPECETEREWQKEQFLKLVNGD
jgi:hypothetical protein